MSIATSPIVSRGIPPKLPPQYEVRGNTITSPKKVSPKWLCCFSTPQEEPEQNENKYDEQIEQQQSNCLDDCFKVLLNPILRVSAFKSDAIKVAHFISTIEKKLDSFSHDKKTGLPFKKEQGQELRKLIDQFESILLKFCTEYSILSKTPERINLFTETMLKVCELNKTIFERTAFSNKKTNYVLIDISYFIYKIQPTIELSPELQIEMKTLYLRDLNLRLERNEVPTTSYKLISIQLSALVLKFSQFENDSQKKGIHFILKYILRMNHFLFEKDLAVDVTPLMNPAVIEKFDLKEKIPEIVQADVTQFYFEEVAKLGELVKQGKVVGADDFAVLSEKYAQKTIPALLNPQNNQIIVQKIFSNLIWLTFYAYSFLFIYEEKERNNTLKNIFKKINFNIPKTYISTRDEDYLTLKVTTGFILNLQTLIYNALTLQNFQINPFADFTQEQIENLKQFVISNYGAIENTPKSMRDWIYHEQRGDDIFYDIPL